LKGVIDILEHQLLLGFKGSLWIRKHSKRSTLILLAGNTHK